MQNINYRVQYEDDVRQQLSKAIEMQKWLCVGTRRGYRRPRGERRKHTRRK